MELGDRETGAADHLDVVHTGHAASQDCGDQLQDLSWRGGRQVNVGQDRILRLAVIRRALYRLKRAGEHKQMLGIFLSLEWSTDSFC